jgi:hypothetical protein
MVLRCGQAHNIDIISILFLNFYHFHIYINQRHSREGTGCLVGDNVNPGLAHFGFHIRLQLVAAEFLGSSWEAPGGLSNSTRTATPFKPCILPAEVSWLPGKRPGACMPQARKNMLTIITASQGFLSKGKSLPRKFLFAIDVIFIPSFKLHAFNRGWLAGRPCSWERGGGPGPKNYPQAIPGDSLGKNAEGELRVEPLNGYSTAGWGRRIRTSIGDSKGRCPAIGRSPRKMRQVKLRLPLFYRGVLFYARFLSDVPMQG